MKFGYCLEHSSDRAAGPTDKISRSFIDPCEDIKPAQQEIKGFGDRKQNLAQRYVAKTNTTAAG